MNKLIIFLFILFMKPVQAQDDVNLFDYWQFYSDVENSMYKYFCSTGFRQLEERKVIIDSLQSKEDWVQRQLNVREKLLDIIGPFPKKTPLNIRITGIIQKDGYHVEKMIYESQPGYYVTSALFVPDNLNGRAPAILNPIGHSTLSFRRDVYQHTIINLVKKGFIVLAYDPVGQGERVQYYDTESKKSRYRSSTLEHSYPGAQCFISGYSPAKYFIWDGIRGVDVLLSRKEVDPNRIGMTGISGGGTSTTFIGAVDDRIKAIAPECYITNYNYLLKSMGPQDAEQNLFRFIHHGLDYSDLLEVRAPKPTLIMSTTRDFFSIQGARETHLETIKAYTALGRKNNLQITEVDSVHSFSKKNREAMYAFFQKHLDNKGDSTDCDVTVISDQDLWVTETGQLATSLKGETIFSLNEKVVGKQVLAIETSRTNLNDHLSKIPNAAIALSGFSFPEKFEPEIFSGRYLKKTYKLEKYLLPGSGGYMLPLALFVPNKNSKGEAVLLLHEKGKNFAVNNDSLAKQLVAKGYTVLLADLPGIGELGPGYLKGDAHIDNISYNLWFSSILTGKSIVGLRAEDMLRITHFIKTNLSDYDSTSVISIGVLGSELLHAAVFDREIQKICLIRPFLSYTDIALALEYEPIFIPSIVAGAIDNYDLSDLMATFCPREILIVNPLSANGQITNAIKSRNSLAFPFKVYGENQVSQNLELVTGMNDRSVMEHLLSWLK